MSDFVEIQHDDGGLDFVNREFVARVEALSVPGGEWLVKVLMSSGTEVLDIRAPSREAAAARVDALLGRTTPTAG